jgi:hypothetical protein
VVTIQDKARFKQAFNRLAVAVRLPAEQADASMQRVYWDGLETLPIESVEDAAAAIAAQAVWFPKLAEWKDAAEKASNARVLKFALPDPGRGWHSECGTCDDTGWESLTCAGGRQCGRTKEHAEHSYVVPCACRPTNHTYQRKRAEERERARGKEGASKQQRRSSNVSEFTRVGE